MGLQTVDFATSDLGSVLFTLTRSSTLFYVSKLIVYENTGDVFAGFETGRHIILGDSWVATSGFGVIGAFEERFPNATFVNLGHGGDKASDLWARYNSDVLGEVATNGLASSLMIIVGTNDYFAGTTPAAFGGYISSMVSKTVALGMIPIVFTSSVGSADVDTGRFNLSRRYVDEVAYYDQDYEWRDYTPTITASSGTISSVSATARYKVVGRLCYFKATVVITSKGTGAGILNVTTPFFGGATPANCRAGSALAVATWSGANITVVSATGTTIIADSTTVYIAGFNEI